MGIRDSKDGATKDVVGVEEAMARISLEMMSPEGLKLFAVTDVTPEECFALPTLNAIKDRFHSAIMKEWIEKFLLLRISMMRNGRQEFVILGSGMKERGLERGKRRGLGDLFSGFG
jgi:hypothetical protein